MNNHKKDDLLNHKIGKKCDKENTNLGNLLKVMLIHLSFFLNLKSIFNLSSTNKKLRKLFMNSEKSLVSLTKTDSSKIWIRIEKIFQLKKKK